MNKIRTVMFFRHNMKNGVCTKCDTPWTVDMDRACPIPSDAEIAELDNRLEEAIAGDDRTAHV